MAPASARPPAPSLVKGEAAKPPAPPRVPTAPTAPTAPRAAKPASVPPPVPSVPPAPVSSVIARVIPRSSVEPKTVREILPPWHVLQEKLQSKVGPVATRNEALNQDAQQALEAQEAGAAMWAPPASSSSPVDSYEPPPSSGIRLSDAGNDGNDGNEAHEARAAGPSGDLSFKVYTLAELERRSDAPVSMRSSRLAFDLTSSRSSRPWQRVAAALRVFVSASLAWLGTKELRPRVTVALRKPFDDLGDELQVAVESIDWKKVGVTTGIVVGATLTLLFAVLTAAELTDDLKPPGSAAHRASAETTGIPARTALGATNVAPASNMAAMGMQQVAAPVVIAPPPPATSIGDVDAADETEAPAPPPKKAKKPAAKPKTTGKLTMRTAPF